MSQFDANQLFLYAKGTGNAATDEVGYRTAVSRLYYACFLATAKRAHDKRIWTLHRLDCHTKLIRQLKSRGAFSGLGSMLAELRDLRVHVDYHLDINPIAGWNDDCLECSKRRNGESTPESEWRRAMAIGDKAYQLAVRI